MSKVLTVTELRDQFPTEFQRCHSNYYPDYEWWEWVDSPRLLVAH